MDLENCVKEEVQSLRKIASERQVVLLDYTTNGDLDDLSTPLSHAALVKRFIENDWPV